MKDFSSEIAQDSPLLPQLNEVWQPTLAWQPTAEQQQQFQRLYKQILAGNRQLNLTRITEPHEFWEKHLWDSLRGIQPWLTENLQPELSTQKVIDIGTGAGFPGVPVAIVQPQWQMTLLDSTRKKVAFLEALTHDLGLSNVQSVTDRAEQFGQQPNHRGSYDLALIRAVATAAVCAEYSLPLLKVGGIAVLYRGQWTEAEAIGLERALEQLGGELMTVEAFTTPLSEGSRHCLYLKKIKPTPAAFPRSVGVPTQKPL